MKGLPKRAGAFLFGIHQAGFPGEVYLPPFYILRPGERRKERIAVYLAVDLGNPLQAGSRGLAWFLKSLFREIGVNEIGHNTGHTVFNIFHIAQCTIEAIF